MLDKNLPTIRYFVYLVFEINDKKELSRCVEMKIFDTQTDALSYQPRLDTNKKYVAFIRDVELVVDWGAIVIDIKEQRKQKASLSAEELLRLRRRIAAANHELDLMQDYLGFYVEKFYDIAGDNIIYECWST